MTNESLNPITEKDKAAFWQWSLDHANKFTRIATPEEAWEAAIKYMGDASTRKDEGKAGTTRLSSEPAIKTTSPANSSEIRYLDNPFPLSSLDPVGWVNMPHEDKTPGKRVVGFVFQDKWPGIKQIQDMWDAATREPVSVSQCAEAVMNKCCKHPFSWERTTKAVLEEVGVQHVA